MALACFSSATLGRDGGDGTEEVREEGLSLRHRGRPEVRRRSSGCPAPGPGERPPCPRPASSPAATGPAPPTESDGGGGAEGPAWGQCDFWRCGRELFLGGMRSPWRGSEMPVPWCDAGELGTYNFPGLLACRRGWRGTFLGRVSLIKEAHRSELLRQVCLPRRPTSMRCVARSWVTVFTWLSTRQHAVGRNYTRGACEKPFYFRANLHHQKQHTGEKPLRSDVRRALFVNSCKFYVSRKPFTFGDVGKDFLGNSGFLHQQATRTWEKSNSGTERETPFPRGKNHYKWGDCPETFSGKHTCSAPESPH